MWPDNTFFDKQREQFYDFITQLVPAPQAAQIVVVDVDHIVLTRDDSRGLDRVEIAKLFERVAESGATAIATDVIFSADCDRQRQGNVLMAGAISRVPVVMGFLLSDKDTGSPHPVPPLAVRRPFSLPGQWPISNAEVSCSFFQDNAHSSAGAFLIGDDDAHIRRVQAYSVLGTNAYPTLGLEGVRLAAGTGAPIIGGSPPWLKLGKSLFELDADGNIRFAASSSRAIAQRTVSADDVIRGNFPSGFFTGKLVFIGSSLPQLGGLRPTASMPLEPSIQIHADVANAILTGFVPHRHENMPTQEAAFVLIAGVILGITSTCLRLMPVALIGIILVLLALGCPVALYAFSASLIDGFGIVLSLLFILLITGLAQFATVEHAEVVARRKFSQYLPRSVVDRYLDNQKNAPLAPEVRPVTAVFTDIEGFSALSQKLSPLELVALLNVYFGEVNALIAAHGGMVDKVVGDAVHAFFNAPEDLEAHVDKAIDCAEAIHTFTEEVRLRPDFAEWGFGRTRIGLETGIAVLGEVGAAGKLDYTAHGDAINLASRLQEANKFLGTAICIGPEAALASRRTLHSLGPHEVRGFGLVELFTL